MQSLKIHITRQWWVWVLLICTLFAFPDQAGLKTDPSLYGALAENIATTGQWWPLSLMPEFFHEFYEHPPGVVWMMAAIFKAVPVSTWSVKLLSRMSVLGVYCLVVVLVLRVFARIFKLDSMSAKLGGATLVLLILHTWMGWLKYAGDGQLEGPTSLALTAFLTVVLMIEGDNDSGTSSFRFRRIDGLAYVSAVLIGAAGFLFKGVFFLPLLMATGVWAVVYRRAKTFLIFLSASIGAGLSISFLKYLDVVYRTHFFDVYIHKQILHRVFGAPLEATGQTSLSFAKLAHSVISWMRMELQLSPLWIAICLALVVYRLIQWKQSPLRRPLVALLAFCLAAFYGAICLSSQKMPHWAVPMYPIAALLLVSLMPSKWFVGGATWLGSARLGWFGAAVASLLAIIPTPQSTLYRGQDWQFQAPFLKQAADKGVRLVLVKSKIELDWPQFQYARFFLGPKYKLDTCAVADTACYQTDNTALLVPGMYQPMLPASLLASQGFEQSMHQQGALRVYLRR